MTTTASSVPGVPLVLSGAARRHPGAARRLTAVHAAALRGSCGRLAASWFGIPVLLLETTGRRSGRPRRSALVYLLDDEDLVVVAANAGAERAPAWWHNLQAAGAGVVIRDGERRTVTATMIDGARRERLWQRFAAVSRVEHYQRQTARRLPVVALTPLAAPARARPARARATGRLAARPRLAVA